MSRIIFNFHEPLAITPPTTRVGWKHWPRLEDRNTVALMSLCCCVVLSCARVRVCLCVWSQDGEEHQSGWRGSCPLGGPAQDLGRDLLKANQGEENGGVSSRRVPINATQTQLILISPEEAHQQQRVHQAWAGCRGVKHTDLRTGRWTFLLHPFRRYYSQDVKTNWGIFKVHPVSSLSSRAKQLS